MLGTHIKPIRCLRLLKFIVVQFVFTATAAAAKLRGILAPPRREIAAEGSGRCR